MAKSQNLATMSLDALVKLRDDVTAMLGKQAEAIEEQLSRLTDRGTSERAPKSNKLKGRRVAVKYRDKNGNTWSGRGAQPRWMTAAIKAGARRDDFLVGQVAKKSAKKAKKSAKKARPAKKAKLAKRSAKRAKLVRRAKRPSAHPKAKASKSAKRPSAHSQAKIEAAKQAKRAIPQPEPSADVSPVMANSSPS